MENQKGHFLADREEEDFAICTLGLYVKKEGALTSSSILDVIKR